MLGYIKIYRNELKIKHIRMYKDMYCELCTTIGKEFGLIYRIFVSYDVTFFLSIFDSLTDGKSEKQIMCPINKRMNKNIMISKDALDYCSLISIYWIIQKIRDDKFDREHGLKNLILKRLFSSNKKIIAKLNSYSGVLKSWDALIKNYYVDESNPTCSFDELINSIGHMYGRVFSDYIEVANIEVDKNALFNLGFYIGVYIYLMDAYDDYFEDVKKNKFNPITRMKDYSQIKNDKFKMKEKIEGIVHVLLSQIGKYAQELNFSKGSNSYIIENIVFYGMKNVFDVITKKKYIKRSS